MTSMSVLSVYNPPRPHARTPARPHARTPASPHARTCSSPQALTPARTIGNNYLKYKNCISPTINIIVVSSEEKFAVSCKIEN